MNGGAKTSPTLRDARERPATSWRSIEARPTEPGEGDGATGVSRSRWLAALHRLQNGEALGGLQLVDSACAPVTDPASVDWTGFPVLEALEAVSRDELRRLRSLLDETPLPCTTPVREDGFTPPGGLVWGLDLRRAPSSEL
jgi:hypothetical protein